MLSDISLAHDLVKSEIPDSPSKVRLLQTLNSMLVKAKKLTDEATALEKRISHYKGRLEKIELENESLRRLI